jgi:hypothetical protein
MAGFGTGPYGLGPFGQAYLTPTQTTRASLSSSRAIDTYGHYVVADDGGFEPMDDTAQRVILLINFNVKPPQIITPKTMAAQEQAIRAALRPLTAGKEPAVKDVKIVVSDGGGAKLFESVTYFDIAAKRQQTVKPDGTVVIR